MRGSVLEQYQIADLLEWYKAKRLVINPYFQRRNVWTPNAKVYLIDTILRQLPIPKIYMRQKVDLEAHTSYREVVDGQQRLRAIFDFASDNIILTKRAKEYAGLTYSTLSDEDKETFLSYPIAVAQLINASDEDVLEVFARLNSYTLPLNPQELRHAKFQGDFKWTVYDAAKQWSMLWDNYQVVSVRERLRMADDQLMAEMYGIVLRGVAAGSQLNIHSLYTGYDRDFPQQDISIRQVDDTLKFIIQNFEEILRTSIARAPHFLMLFAAVAHAQHNIPPGEIGSDMPKRKPSLLQDIRLARNNLLSLAEIIDLDEQEARTLRPFLYDFWFSSRGTTQGIRSRRTRFPIYFRALLPQEF